MNAYPSPLKDQATARPPPGQTDNPLASGGNLGYEQQKRLRRLTGCAIQALPPAFGLGAAHRFENAVPRRATDGSLPR
jgi:hypothetical protein